MNDHRPLNRDNYFYFTELSTRWMDNDVYGHVNNVTYYSYFDTVANLYLIEQADFDIQTAEVIGFVVASRCDYHKPIAFPDKIEAAYRVNRIGSKSVEYGIAIFQQGESSASAHGTFTHVFVERDSGQSVLIPSAMRSAFERALVV